MGTSEIRQKSSASDWLRYWLALARAPGIGAGTFAEIIAQTPDLSDLFRGGDTPVSLRLPEPALRYLRQPDWRSVDEDLAWSTQPGNRIVTLHCDRYPPLLKTLRHPPPILFVKGNASCLGDLQLAIVGSRNPSQGGKRTAHAFSRYLAQRGLTITSGLAAGIDTAAHVGALDAGGRTISVLGTGPDRVYPADNRRLAHSIAESGALVSEFPPGTPPLAAHFPRRNRLISGLSLGVLVVEAAQRSGSLITARLATEQGREVFAIPGSIHNPLTRGCHQLIRQGAKLVENAEHVLEELGSLALATLTPSGEEFPQDFDKTIDHDYQQLLDSIGYDPVSIDQLVGDCGLTPEQLSSMLLILELEGHIVNHPGGRYSRNR
jgi:DNA processing protein